VNEATLYRDAIHMLYSEAGFTLYLVPAKQHHPKSTST